MDFSGKHTKKQIANIITCSRILCAFCLLFTPVFSVIFYILYLFCGMTDLVDGTVARKTKAVSAFGAKLDTAADMVFTAVCVAKVLPLIHLPVWLWIWITVIAVIKIVNILWGLICSKQLIALHTFLNKATGFLLFLFPLTLSFIEPMCSAVAICSLAMPAAIQEWYHIRTDRKIF